ncbi:hypothetical protein YPPY54_4242, partial [Yersinia pestis PY-54]
IIRPFQYCCILNFVPGVNPVFIIFLVIQSDWFSQPHFFVL